MKTTLSLDKKRLRKGNSFTLPSDEQAFTYRDKPAFIYRLTPTELKESRRHL